MRAALHSLWLRGLSAPAPWRYGVGIAAALVASLVRIALNPLWGANFPYIFFFPTTLFTALFAGAGPAWVGIAICAVTTLTWVLPPVGALVLDDRVNLGGLLVYVVADGLVAWIGSTHRGLIAESERQRVELLEREAALVRSEATAQRLALEAESASRAKDDFVAVLSHELRTPLTTIVSGIRLIRRACSREEPASRAREAIERQADHLSRLVDDLLDMKQIVSGRITLTRHPCDLAELVGGCTSTLNEAGRFKNHTVSLDVVPVKVNGDEARLQQVVTNLLGNAVKYTPAGGSIRVTVKRECDDAVLRVQDTGIGISSDALARIFDLFVQGDPGAGRVRSGLGIGLAVVRRLVEFHGGTVEAWSDGPGNGSTFTVRLPAAP